MTFLCRFILALVVMAAFTGCVQQTAQPDATGRTVRTGDTPGSAELPAGPTPPNAIDAIDPVGSRLQDLGGLLIQYHLLHKRLPASLADLKPLADTGDVFTDPKSGQPFVYVPQAARMAPGDTRVVVYAPSRSSDGRYQGILMRLGRGSQITAIWVVGLSELELQAQIPGSPTAPRATQPAP